MPDLFFYGTLRHIPLLEVVLGRPLDEDLCSKASLPGKRAAYVRGEAYPALRTEEGATAEGLLVSDVSTGELDRLQFYEDPDEFQVVDYQVETSSGLSSAKAFQIRNANRVSTSEWDFDSWLRNHSLVTIKAAEDIMALYGKQSASDISRRMGLIQARAWSFERARKAPPKVSDIRFVPAAGDVEVIEQTTPYANFFTMEELEIRHRTFGGGVTETLHRSAFVTVDVVTVLPYDPIRDRVLLVEQFRVGPLARGDRNPWSLEAVAGRIDAGETPEDAALREAREETHLEITELVPISNYYTTPGGVTEYLYAFIGLTDLPDGCARLGGATDEGEDIRAHLLEFGEFRDLLEAGTLENSPLILSGLWLLLNHQRLKSIA